MKATIGWDAGARKRGQDLPVTWDSDRVANPHIMIVGTSGSGKTYTITHMAESMVNTSRVKPRVHVFDLHGDMHIPGASEVLFYKLMPYGLNPLRVSPDPVYGGVYNCIENFIDIVNKVSPTSLGVNQDGVLRDLLLDLYKIHGFDPHDPATWKIDPSKEVLVNGGNDNRVYLSVDISEKDDVKALGARWDPEKKLWWIASDQYQGSITKWLPKTVGRTNPTVSELMKYAERVWDISYMGSDQKGVMTLELFNKQAKAYQRKFLQMAKRGNAEWSDAEMKEALEKAREKALQAYTDYLMSVRTGEELDMIKKYESPKVLQSVLTRIKLLIQGGIFKNEPFPFDDGAPIWHYKLDPLQAPDQTMFVFFRLKEIWEKAIQRGHSKDILDVIVLDEFGRYSKIAKDDDDNIINVLAREARKYGIALIVAGQDPTAFPQGVMSSIGTKIVLGVDETYWGHLEQKLRMDPNLIKWIRLKQTIGVQFKEQDAIKNEWHWTFVKKSQASSGEARVSAFATR